MRRLRGVIFTVSLGLSIAGCQLLPVAGPAALPGFTVDRTPTVLTEPRVFDWTFHAIGGKHVTARREEHRQRELLAYPSATNWTGGLNLTALGCGAGDTLPNGPATVFATKSTPASIGGKAFLLSQQGKFIRVDRADAGNYATLDLGRTFTRTYVTLSPAASRAYVVSDDGTLFVINTVGMTVLAQVALGATAVGCAAVFDPYTADHGGKRDEIYVSDNDGYVSKFTWADNALSAQTRYAVAAGVTPIGGGTSKIAAPPLAIDRVIYVGDQAGGFHMYDTQNTANNVAFFTGARIDTAPAIEIQDGSYSIVDPAGSPKSVPLGAPIYAFVAAGANCFWLDLHAQRSARSMSLYLDDNSPAMNHGYLHNYTYDASTEAAAPLNLVDWCAIRTDHETVLAGADPGMNKTKSVIGGGEVDAASGDGTLAGGPVVCYMRFSTGSPTTAVVKEARLALTVEKGGWTKLPEFRSTDTSFLKGTSTIWDFASLTNANRPDYNTANIAIPIAITVNQWGNTQVNAGNKLEWDISEGFTGGAASDYTVVYLYNRGGKVLWEPGEQSGDNGPKADFVDGTLFATPDAAAAKRPELRIRTSIGSFPSPTIETPPVIDAINKKVYLFYCNALYAISFASVADFEDGDAATPKTLFNTSRLGRNATVGGVAYAGGAGYAPDGLGRKRRYVNNKTAPVFNYNLTYAYLLDRYPQDPSQTAPTAWDYGLSKVQLPLSAAADRLVTSAAPPLFDNVPGEPSSFMVIDPFTNVNSTGGNIFFGLGNGRAYQYDR